MWHLQVRYKHRELLFKDINWPQSALPPNSFLTIEWITCASPDLLTTITRSLADFDAISYITI